MGYTQQRGHAFSKLLETLSPFPKTSVNLFQNNEANNFQCCALALWEEGTEEFCGDISFFPLVAVKDCIPLFEGVSLSQE